ncbi:bifunctional hydroxymethylpyrimidine kinase/phosphomethylpyrimidine kinase [Salinithrix halophila]|uniref:Hydroxymethylpyrimidine/phosphomethylpyrimidine kinase n=1 Tax=Salinithrix halophila TaxID=1485204 RepID=A0ABV8JIP4_9BACL
MELRRALSVAGSNSRGGAGLQADLKTFQELDVYGMGVVTSIVTLHGDGRRGIHTGSPETVEDQLDAAVSSIGVDSVKTGMLYSGELVRLVARKVKELALPNLVVDPVIITKNGGRLMKPDALDAMREELLPLATVVTPNLPEAAALAEMESIRDVEGMMEAARRIHQLGPGCVVVKGGRLPEGDAEDLLFDGRTVIRLRAKRVEAPHTNGAGCTFSAAVTAELAKGKTAEEAVRRAKTFVTEAIRRAWPLGGQGSVNQAAPRWSREGESPEPPRH